MVARRTVRLVVPCLYGEGAMRLKPADITIIVAAALIAATFAVGTVVLGFYQDAHSFSARWAPVLQMEPAKQLPVPLERANDYECCRPYGKRMV